MKRQPDLRLSVVSKLAKAAKVKTGTLANLIEEEATKPDGTIEW